MRTKILLICAGSFLSFYFYGCAANNKIEHGLNKRPNLKEIVDVKDQELQACRALTEEKEKQLFQLRLELVEKDNQLKEKELKVKELKKKLESFGSF